MGAYVTQTRKLRSMIDYATSSGSVSGLLEGPKDSYQHSSGNGCEQKTTSWRTGRSALEADPFANEEGGTHADGGGNWGSATSRIFDDSGRRVGTISRSSADTGHTFDTQKRWIEYSHVIPYMRELKGSTPTSTKLWYQGPIILNSGRFSGGGTADPWYTAQDFSQNYYGPAAIKATSPTNPVAGLAVGLAELKREGIPHSLHLFNLRKKAEEIKRVNASGLFLETEFGWKPLLSEINTAIRAVSRSKKIWEQYSRDAGKRVRRSYSFPREFQLISSKTGDVGEVTTCSNQSAVNSRLFPNGRLGPQTEEVTLERRVWFRGAYTYTIPSNESFVGKLARWEQQGNALLGLRLTPDVLWNLSPWSWLSDWAVNVGDNITNLTNLTNDGLVLVYGYLMVEETTRHTVQVTAPDSTFGARQPYSMTFVQQRKRRFKATPYGFGLNPSTFTDRQWSILGALGLSGGPRSMRHPG